MVSWIVVFVVLGVSHLAANLAWAQGPPADVSGPFVGQAAAVGKSAEVHRLPVATSAPAGPVFEIPRWGTPIPLPSGKPRVPDALVVPAAPADRRAPDSPLPTLSFEGIPATNIVPPDPIGDVGPNHYVQMVNAKFAVFDKTGGLLSGPTDINLLFAGLGGGNQCVINNDGDPVVVYDRLADRWVLSQFAVPGGPGGFHLCIAVSQTPDPTGAYFLYDFAVPVYPDYFKLGVWPDAYYVSTNEGAPGPVGAYALERAKMLQGLAATSLRFVVADKNFLLPSDLKGVRPPPAASPNYFYTFTDGSFPTWGGGADRLDLYAFHADFAVPANSTFTALPSVNITAFNYTICGFLVFDCIPQPAPGEKVDAVSEWPMWRFAYRNLQTHEALVGNFTVDVTGSGQAGIRWFELRKSGAGNWTLFQEGTHAPDTAHRWMGSIAMDGNGNIALGYSVSSTGQNPSLRYAARLPGTAPGTLEPEEVLINGLGVQTGGANRWGDYSAMTIDPSDDCTFWYTGEYYAATSAAGWSTRIGAFKIPTCQVRTFEDVPPSHFAFLYVEALAAAGLVGGCSTHPSLYCPDLAIGRLAMAIVLVRGIHGAGFTPPAPTGIFADMPPANPFSAWAEQLYNDGVTGGCSSSPLRFCPFDLVTRSQMAVFVLRAKHGAGYTPPPAVGVFADVPPSDIFAPWIEQLAAEGITGGCGGGNFCPDRAITRAEAAVFVARAFGLPL